MPRGRPPKQYPQEVVDSVSDLYARGLTQAEIARELGFGQKVVWNVMRRHGIRARKAAKRNQRGSKNGSWKGSRASYAAFHKRVEARRGTPATCMRCDASGPGRTYDWANLTGRYDDPSDYERMCRSCHRLYDLHRSSDPAEE